METVEAVAVVAYETAEDAQEVDLETLCPPADLDRADVVMGAWRVTLPSDQPLRDGRRELKVSLHAALERLRPGDKARVEFFYPGEAARMHGAGAGRRARVKR